MSPISCEFNDTDRPRITMCSYINDNDVNSKLLSKRCDRKQVSSNLCKKRSFRTDNEDSGLGMDELDLSFTLLSDAVRVTPKYNGQEFYSEEELEMTPCRKRRRTNNVMSPTDFSPLSNIIRAVDRLSTDSDLVSDGSRPNCLHIIPDGKHKDLNAISTETMTDVLQGKYNERLDQVTIIDCRYPYEYDGGHIKGAINLYTKDSIQNFLNTTVTSPNEIHVVIFHCEFSSERGPKMCRFLRSLDREMNKDIYPRLNFPELYLLEGGYKEFFQTNMVYCEPHGYKPMLHKEHSGDLRHFRVKSKSWSAGERKRGMSHVGGGVRLTF